jgi:hypothetical protein
VVSETGFATAIVYRGEGALRRYARLARCTVEDRNRSAAIVSQQERRASARRGVSDVLAQKNEFVVRGERQNQERRASARRGSQAAPATTTVYRGVTAFLAHD